MQRLGLKTFLRTVRAPFFTAAIVPVLVGTTIAWSEGTFYLGYFLLTLLGAVVIHGALNVSNDYFDHLTGNDDINQELTPFSGGSRVIQEGIVPARQMAWIAVILFLLGIAIGLYLTAMRGLPILWLGLAGIFLSVFQNAPPIRFSYRGHGLGELAVGAGFGPLMVLGSYYVQVQRFSGAALWASLPVGLLIALVLYINEFPDYRADKAVRKQTLVVLLGRKRAVWGYIALIVATYLAFLVGIVAGILPATVATTFLTLPLAWRGIQGARRFYSDTPKLIPTNAITIQIHLVTGLLLCLGYALHTVL